MNSADQNKNCRDDIIGDWPKEERPFIRFIILAISYRQRCWDVACAGPRKGERTFADCVYGHTMENEGDCFGG